ncbi:MAG: hypothetical protein WD794_02115 [Mycobacteriales bacterium]
MFAVDPRVVEAVWSSVQAHLPRLAAWVVLVLGALVLLAAVVSVALDEWETSWGKVLILFLVAVGMWRAIGHLRRASSAR